MIFITVGTHEQGLDRLLIEVDKLIEKKIINEKVFAQIGYSDYVPKNYEYKRMISFEEMNKKIKNSSIIITHGGPGSIFHAIQYNKIPIVVPRNSKFNEHVDDHQILFVKRLENEKKVIAIYDIESLGSNIVDYCSLCENCNVTDDGKNQFIEKFKKKIDLIL